MTVIGFLPSAAFAQCVTVAPNICVTLKTYDVSPNEQPFYGFIEKTPQMRLADQELIDTVLKNTTREQGAEQAIARGWDAFQTGDLGLAGRRFNQAFLLNPGSSHVYHMYAILVEQRFKDYVYAEELYKIAMTLPKPYAALNADYGRLLLITNRPREALPILEQAVKETPTNATAWSNLGFARQLTGNLAGACAARERALQLYPSQMVVRDSEILKDRAGCK